MNNYRRGAKLEYDTKKEYENKGAKVTRSAGSHGAWDLCVVFPSQVHFIQLKRVKKGAKLPDFAEDIRRLEEVVVPENVTREFIVWQDGKGMVKHLIMNYMGEVWND